MTLIELITAMILGAIVLCVMTVQFVTALQFQTVINNDIATTQEAELAMYNMTQILRFALSSPTPSNTDNSGYGYLSSITAKIKRGHLPNITTDTIVEYGVNPTNDKNGNNLYYIFGTNSPIIIASNIITFTPNWSPTNNNFTIILTAQKGKQTVTLNTTIQTLP